MFNHTNFYVLSMRKPKNQFKKWLKIVSFFCNFQSLQFTENGSVWFCFNFRELNKVTKVWKYRLTNPSSCFNEFIGKLSISLAVILLWSLFVDSPCRGGYKKKRRRRRRRKKRPSLFGQSCNGAYCMFCGWLPKFYVQSLQPSPKICRSSFAEVSKSKSQSQVKQVQIWHILGVAGFNRNFILQK